MNGSLEVLAEETSSGETAEISEEITSEEITSEGITSEETTSEEAISEESTSEGQTTVLLASAGFSYAFSAKKVSLRDVEDRMYDDGVILAKRTGTENGLVLSASAAEIEDGEDGGTETGETETDDSSDAEKKAEEEDEALIEEDRAIEETTLTPVQKKEQSVVDAVSETQNIEVDTATATILAATAVSVVSDTETAAALAEMVDRKQTQAKLDQGVITAVEAEALMAASESSQETSSGEQTETSSDAESQETADQGSEQDTQTQTEEAATDANGNEIVVAQVTDYINVREDASEDSEIVGMLYNGSVATVLGRTGNGWVRIQSGDVYGYIREEYVATGSEAAELAESVATMQAVVTTETLRVRAAPIADSDVISLIAGGETLEILEEVDGWYKVNTVDGEGYISSDFADVEQVYPWAVSVEDAEESTDTSSSTESTGSSSSSSGTGATSALNTYTGGTSTSSASGSSVVSYALQFVGNPYVWGGTSLTNGADCSGFTMAVYAAFGVSLPHNSTSQASCGTAVASLDEAQPGDLLIYDGHVAIYMGNNQIVHASNPANGICTGTATYRTIIAIRRIFN